MTFPEKSAGSGQYLLSVFAQAENTAYDCLESSWNAHEKEVSSVLSGL
jgi:hypothetical protein